MIKYEDVKNMPLEYWMNLMTAVFKEFLEDFKEGYWYEVDTNEIAERVLIELEK